MEPNTPLQQPDQQVPNSTPPTQPEPQPVTPPPAPSTAPAEPMRGTENNKKMLMIAGIIIVLLIASAAYFWLMPMSQASAYKSRVQTAYNSQHASLQAAIDTFNQNDVFKSTENSDSQQGEQDLSAAGKIIDTAQSQTNNLQQQATSPFLPGATALGVGKDADALQPKVTDYIAKSKAFLDDFQKLDKYISDFNEIGKTQSPPAIKSLNAIVGPTKADLLPQTQSAMTSMGALVDALRKLNPPADLKDYTNKLIDAFAQTQTAITGINQGLKDGDDSAVHNNALQMTSASINVSLLSHKNPLDALQPQDSSFQKELAAVKDASVSF